MDFDTYLASIAPPEGEQSDGKDWERACKAFLKQDPVYKATFSEVWLWDECPLVDGPDMGLDLVATAYDGTTWGIQSKHYGPENPVDLGDLSKSHLQCVVNDFDGLLVMTTSYVGPNAERELGKLNTARRSHVQFKQLLYGDFILADFPWETIESHIEFVPVERKLHDHQVEALRAAARHYGKAKVGENESNHRGQVKMPCGTGKTLFAYHWIMDQKATRPAIAVPRLDLIHQTLSSMQQQHMALTGEPFRYQIVCGANESGKDANGLEHVSSEVGLPTTTDSHRIAKALKSDAPFILTIFTYQSIDAVVKALSYKNVPEFDVLVGDESHHLAGSNAKWPKVLDDDLVPAGNRLFLTATPVQIVDHIKTRLAAKNLPVFSMDDENQFGKRFYEYTDAQATKDGMLAPFQVVATVVDNEEIARLIGNNKTKWRINGLIMDAEYVADHVAVWRFHQEYGVKHILPFFGRVKEAREFARDHQAVLDALGLETKVHAESIDGSDLLRDRRAKVRRFVESDADYTLLASCGVLGEGVDIPEADGAVFMVPKQSGVDIQQSSGRVRRINPADLDKVSYLLLPIYISPSEMNDKDEWDVTESSTFRYISRFLRTMVDFDPMIYANITVIISDDGKTPRIRRKPKASGASITVIVPSKRSPHFVDSIRLRILDTNPGRNWECLKEHMETYGIPDKGFTCPKACAVCAKHEVRRWDFRKQFILERQKLNIERERLGLVS